MNVRQKTNELFEASHLMILISYTFFSFVLIGEGLILSWEPWALPIIVTGITISWGLHIRQGLTEDQRLWVYSFLMMITFFFYGIHLTSTYDLAPVMTAVIMLYTMTGETKLVTLCLITYYLTMAYDLGQMILSGYEWDMLTITRTFLHLALIFMVSWISRVIMSKWLEVMYQADDKISRLEDATARMNDFLANVSHELRTPVNAVVGLTSVMLEKETDPEIRRDMHSVAAAGQRVSIQISDILDWSEIDMHRLMINNENYLFSSLISDILQLTAEFKPDHLEFVVDADPSIPTVMVSDIFKLKKMLMHLIGNGFKYTTEGGVYVRFTAVKQDYGLNLNVEVTDTGAGMTDAELERVFDRFYQGDSGRNRLSSGLGLGLPIVSGFAETLGGFVTIESRVNVGTTVRLSLPQKIADASPCLSINNTMKVCVGGYFQLEKFPHPQVREYYSNMVLHLAHGVGLMMHRVNSIDEVRMLVSRAPLTHLFLGDQEYTADAEYLESLTDRMQVIIVADPSFVPPADTQALLMYKPFNSFIMVDILNSDTQRQKEETMRMYLPSLHALVVDDEPMNLIVASGLLQQYGMTVTTTGSGFEAIELCRKESYDIIFMDHMMPQMDGVETMQRIRSEIFGSERDCPIIALTANAVSAARDMFLTEGFDGFVSKPIVLSELERVLKRVLPKTAIVYRKKEEVPSISQGSQSSFGNLADDIATRHRLLGLAGIDVNQGLDYCQEEDFYHELLLQFVKDAPVKMEKMSRFASDGDLNNYAIIVHGLKGNAKMLGANDVMEHALSMETAAKNNKKDEVDAHSGELLDAYRSLVDGIKTALSIKDEIAPKEDSASVLEFAPKASASNAGDAVLEFAPKAGASSVLEFAPKAADDTVLGFTPKDSSSALNADDTVLDFAPEGE